MEEVDRHFGKKDAQGVARDGCKDTKEGSKAMVETGISRGNIWDEKRRAEQKTSEIKNTLNSSVYTAEKRETRRRND